MGGEAGITLHGDQKDFGCHQGELKEEGEKIGGGGGVVVTKILSVATWVLMIKNLLVAID